jgi:hypothetical protein
MITDLMSDLQFIIFMAGVILFAVLVVGAVIVWPLESDRGCCDGPSRIGFSADELNAITRPPPADDPLRRSFAKRGLVALMVGLALLALVPDAAAAPLLAIIAAHHGSAPIAVYAWMVFAIYLVIGVVVWVATGGPNILARSYVTGISQGATQTASIAALAFTIVVMVLVWPSFVLIYLKGLRS